MGNKLQRAPRGLDVPLGTAGQEAAAVKVFSEFLIGVGLDLANLDKINISVSTESSSPVQKFYSLLTAFLIFLQTKKSSKSRSADGLLSALGYYSQVVNLPRERYGYSMFDSK